MLYQEELEGVLHEIMAGWDIPGLAVAIVERDEVSYDKRLGVQSLETKAPITPQSVFCVQSISKPFVATAVMQLVERVKLELDAPLVKYLPYFQMDDEHAKEITIRQVLSHTSGMPDIEEGEYIAWMQEPEYDDGAAERFVRSLSNKMLVAGPGEHFHYSNIGYDVLGDLLAKVSGQSFEDLMQERVLIPSGMQDSTFFYRDVPASLLVWPHLRSPEMKPSPIYPYQRADAPASFLHTTVQDMCHWCMTCLNRGEYHGSTILSPAGYEVMWKPVAKRREPPSMYEQMGLGWNLGHYKGVKTISHGGGGFGWTAFLLIMPEKDCGAVILCNQESDAHLQVLRAVADTLVGEKPKVGAVSWMVPASRAMIEGGIAAAYACYEEIKADGAETYDLDEYSLIGLALELMTAREPGLAIDVLGLNIDVFPACAESYIKRADLYRRKGDLAQAEKDLLRALSIEPENPNAQALLDKVRA
jgi:CubicO group peptidase (beta-lactamase class C family)